MAQAAASVISSTLSLERVRACDSIRSPSRRRLPLFAASFTLPFTVRNSSRGYCMGGLKGQHSTDDGSSSCNPPSFPPHGPSRMSDAVGSPGSADATLVGEDAAAFDIASQSMSSWSHFTAILGVLVAILYVVWIDPETGYGSEYIGATSSLSDSHEMVMLIILFTFALVHSGLASLSGAGEQSIGERAYRVIYAASTLPLAVSAVSFRRS